MKRYCTGAADYGLGKVGQMQMGLLMLGDASVQAMVERARLAEAVGYGTVWLADERFYREVYCCLTHFAVNQRGTGTRNQRRIAAHTGGRAAVVRPPGATRGPRASGPVFEAPALVAGFENVAVVGQPVEQRRGHFGVGEDARPFGEGEIGRQNDRGALVEPADQMKQHLPAAHRERQVAQLVENEEIDADEVVGGDFGLAQ